MDAQEATIDQDLLWDDVMALAAITDPARPYTRRSFSALFDEGRAWLRARFHAAGMTTRIDAGGNLIARLEGSLPDAPVIMLGSHSDTVPSGGRFDGAGGILAALEAVRSLTRAGVTPRHPIEIVDFLAEEWSDHSLSCVGSRAMAGVLEPRMLDYANAEGETLGAAIRRIGGDPERIETARRSDIAGYLELHIEQGIVLERNAVPIGLVTSIVGIARVAVTFKGAADHAGATPMGYRRDASLAAAALTLLVAERATEVAGRGEGHFVATAGVLDLSPNAANVVPGRARVVLDIRAEAVATIDAFIAMLETETAAIAARYDVERADLVFLSRNDPARCDARLRDVLERGAAALGLSSLPLASGAGHDAAFLSRIAPSAMIFVPCRAGKSHCPEEWAEPEALAKGAAVLREAIARLDGRNT
jgi:N-carbamoyl-L-amino-acid hydrolase